MIYLKEAPDRKAQKHYEAWQVIDRAAAAGLQTHHFEGRDGFMIKLKEFGLL